MIGLPRIASACFSAMVSDTDVKAVTVGEIIPVGEFFWIETAIGMAENADHGHRIRDGACPGSADVDCSVRILHVEDDYAIVVLLRPELPYGALAPHGTIFVLPVSTLENWPAMAANRLRQEKERLKMRHSLGRVRA